MNCPTADELSKAIEKVARDTEDAFQKGSSSPDRPTLDLIAGTLYALAIEIGSIGREAKQDSPNTK